MRTHRLEREQVVARPRDEVFAFFADAANLQAITPPFLHFRILTPLPVAMRAGARLDYRLALHQVPLRWRTHITHWEPSRRFVDEQERGPYALWRHTHTFEDAAAGGTSVRDVVEYALPLSPLGTLVHALYVARTLERIFDFRAAVMRQRFGSAVPGGSVQDPPGAMP